MSKVCTSCHQERDFFSTTYEYEQCEACAMADSTTELLKEEEK